jgi:myo-inositol-1(or 4)-monophosphatase
MQTLPKKAAYFAAEKHDGQYRKGTNIPYIAHCIHVALIVRTFTDNEDIISAALLHDTIEDCHDVSYAVLEKEFGSTIATLVNEVTFVKDDNAKALPWREKKGLYISHLRNASPAAVLIAAADKITNMESYFNALLSNPEKVTQFFKGEPSDYFWYYEEIAKIVSQKLAADFPAAILEYNSLFDSYKKMVRNS